MTVIEASFNGTLRTIGLLVIAWWLLRWYLRFQRTRTNGAAGGPSVHAHRTGPQRPPGDVRIEPVPPSNAPGGRNGGTIIDADFEEIT